MIEILAPCGGEDSLPAALNTGADAVYLGVTAFSARKNARNFTYEQLARAVRECRISGVKVYVTMNTLVFDDELAELARTAERIAEAGADGVIVQDPGAAKIIHEAAPSLRLHASTQMTVTSPAGAEFAKKHGFSRVVLARELSREEIADIVNRVDIETEVFVHGALCVCTSGQCLMSAVYGGRSGNRGLCAQPCRLDFTYGGRQNVLSLKDLSLVDDLPELDRLGVTSAKIEGRMKRPEYVAAAVAACRAKLDGREPDLDTLRAVFSRSGFTRAYYDGSMRGMGGIRTKDDVEASAAALTKLRKLYEKPYKRRSFGVSLTVRAGQPVTAEVTCGELSFRYATEIIPEPAINRSITAEEIAERLGKTGGTVFTAERIDVRSDEGLMLTASAINSVRRGIIEELTKRLVKLH